MHSNTQLIIQEESGVTQVADPFAGSYMMESLTEQLEQSAMKLIDEIDALGGMTKAIEAGWPSRKIEETAGIRIVLFSLCRDLLYKQPLHTSLCSYVVQLVAKRALIPVAKSLLASTNTSQRLSRRLRFVSCCVLNGIIDKTTFS